jgi:hypothetical protein
MAPRVSLVPRKKLRMGSGFQSTLWCPGERGKGWKVQPRLPRVGCGGRRENGAGEEVVRRKKKKASSHANNPFLEPNSYISS